MIGVGGDFIKLGVSYTDWLIRFLQSMTLASVYKSILYLSIETSEEIYQSLIGIVGEFAGIQKHAILSADFVTDVGLSFVRALVHLIFADRTPDVSQGVVESANLGITTIDVFRTPLLLQSFGLTVVKPDSTAIAAAIDHDLSS
jgi:hypothetical protein|tara:strand:+ start:332 stop:763 length:432 start_codon:yes stop_codon:yes gene_type:complete